MREGCRKLSRIPHRDPKHQLSDYFWVYERESWSGPRPHKHLAVRSNYILQAVLSRLAGRNAALGRACDIRAIRGDFVVRSYLTKYLVNATARGQRPRYQRRVHYSVRPEPHEHQELGVWLFQPNPSTRAWNVRLSGF